MPADEEEFDARKAALGGGNKFVPPSIDPGDAEPEPRTRPEGSTYSASDIESAGIRLAQELEQYDFQPVILFGNAASGKTSLLLSLFATIKTEFSLRTGLDQSQRLLPIDSEYGDFLHSQAEEFLGRKLYAFMDGKQPSASRMEHPFFVPVDFAPNGKRLQRFAFLESNGEWYRPDLSKEAVFPRLRKQVEDFISHYQRPLIFVHLLPYTQEKTLSQSYDAAKDNDKLYEAQLAIVGALQAYRSIRINRHADQHLVLVTKWDARTRTQADTFEALNGDRDDLLEFVESRYPQCLAAFQSLGNEGTHTALEPYCSGLMTENGVLALKRDNELRPFVIEYPTNLWRWLYRRASEAVGEGQIDPFPASKDEGSIIERFKRLLDKLF